MSHNFDQFWMRRAKTLTQALIISGTVNISLIGTFVYFVVKEKNAAVAVEIHHQPKAQEHSTNEQILRTYSHLSYQDLILKLENKDLAEEGYTRRDLALACLVAFHHFNIEKALGGMLPQKRILYFRNHDATQYMDVVVFPGLVDDQYDGIASYIKTEKWPLTSKGLFFELKRSFSSLDSSLLEAFYTTPECFSVFNFLTKAGLSLDLKTAASLMVDGDWEPLKDFCDKQRLSQDFSVEKRRAFLLFYFDRYRSKIAAELLSLLDLDFVSRRLDDSSLLSFIDMLPESFSGKEKMAKDLLISPRGDDVRKKAASLLYAIHSEPFPEHYDYLAVVKRFCKEALPKPVLQAQPVISQTKVALETVAAEVSKEKAPTAILSKNKMHTIQQGESLWKIAKKYKVTVEEIKKINQLETDKLKVGKQLKIPQQKT